MVNWRQDIEFIYGLIVVITLVIVYFRVSPIMGTELGIGVTAAVGVIEAVIGFAAFESEPAVERWNQFTKKLAEHQQR